MKHIPFALAFMLLGAVSCMDAAEQHRNAVANATTYLSDLKIVVRGVSCAGSDTDLDGYITCTYVRTETEAPTTIACGVHFAGGCKPLPVKGSQQVVQ